MTNKNIENAATQFGKGFSCSQSVFSAFAPELGLEIEDALKIASAFGGGMVRQGEVCGAVTGALMTLGLKYGSEIADDEEKVRQASQKLMQRFKEENGSLLCRDLLGHHLNTPEELEKARNSGVFNTTCPQLVRYAAQLTEDIIGTTK